ncbi:MAG TPA: PH domain-containing protein, partial [Actinoplanes sp.]
AVFLKLAPGRVVVGPDGVHHRGLTFTHFVPWDAVVDVAALWAQSPVILIRTIGSAETVTRNYLGRSTSGPQTLSPFDTVSGRWLAGDPAILLQTLAHYIVHPADRTELGDGTALQRIAANH